MQRRSLFGLPSRSPIPSKITEELVPLMGGLHTDVPGILLDTASSASMSNFIPLDGYITPRSRLSAMNAFADQTVVAQPITGLQEYKLIAGNPVQWISAGTIQGIMIGPSFTSLSFASANGIGSLATVYPQQPNFAFQDYAAIYTSTLNDIMLMIASQSWDTILAGDAINAKFSYLTQAPRARCVGVYDNYALAWNTWEGAPSQTTMHFGQRVRWSDRGDPNNWTTGISGFEDLLAMPGQGTKITTQDNRLLLFTECSLWYGVEAAYPAQFQFQPLEPEVGCPYPRTVQHTPEGLVFLDQDRNLRLLPKIWGNSRIISAPVREIIQANLSPLDSEIGAAGLPRTFAVYDPPTRTYWLVINTNTAGNSRIILSLNMGTGVWVTHSQPLLNAPSLWCGAYAQRDGSNSATLAPGIVWGDSSGFPYSFTSTGIRSSPGVPAGAETLVAPTSTWKSRPLGGDYPGQEKTMLEVRFDYKAYSNSTATITISYDAGNTFPGIGYALPLKATSIVSQAIAYVYGSGRYPTIQFQSESTGYQLHRCHAVYRVGGR